MITRTVCKRRWENEFFSENISVCFRVVNEREKKIKSFDNLIRDVSLDATPGRIVGSISIKEGPGAERNGASSGRPELSTSG